MMLCQRRSFWWKIPTINLGLEDIVNEVKGGYVIKVNGQYYVYLKVIARADNIRSKEEINRQKQEHGHNAMKNKQWSSNS